MSERNTEGKLHDKGNARVHNIHGILCTNVHKTTEEMSNPKDACTPDHTEDDEGKKKVASNKKEIVTV